MVPRPPLDVVAAQLAARTRALRAARDITLRTLAARSGLSLRMLAQVEAGEANPTLSSLLALASALDVELADLLRAPTAADAPRSVAFVGLRGAGKSTVGARAAAVLGWRFVELDRQIEAEAGLSLAALFELHGAAHVRGVEARVVAQAIAAPDPVVMAAGGGLVTAAETWALLRRRTLTVWLRATPQEHWDRVRAQGDERPMAQRSSARAELDALWAARAPLYAEAELHIDTSVVDVEAAVDLVVAAVGRRPTTSGAAP
jgi:XRE family aerobic/anaerobic benzoate catabolism transcriptional regulator